MKKFWSYCYLIAFLFLFQNALKAQDSIPPVSREMRAAWVATVANIDWPSKPGLSVEEQKAEIIKILDRIKTLNMNAVILQIRPQADAFYKSDLEPWSYYLTGTEGKAPEPFYDPLEFWINEAHARGIELHGWLNPYRAGHPAMKSAISDKSVIKTKPGCVKKLASEGYYWLDPTNAEVQNHSYSVVMDIVKRYDIDGIHFDDYFYPYPEYNNNKDFPDEEGYKAYKSKGGKLSVGDWRRDGVNKFIKRVYQGIKKAKPYVKFGISPFGYYRPGYPACVTTTFDQYATLYADAKLWWNKGWVDYFTPQLYWPISRVALSFPVLLDWWKAENKKERNLWPGIILSGKSSHSEIATETVNQIMTTRGIVTDGPGNMFFSMKQLMSSKDTILFKSLSEGPYKTPALIPAYPFLRSKAPKAPELSITPNGDSVTVSWKSGAKEEITHFVLYIKNDGKWSPQIFSSKILSTSLKTAGSKITAVAVSAIDRYGNESRKTIKNF
jgi:uncharacterized lipoprotein YddW (UPF0748 family)